MQELFLERERIIFFVRRLSSIFNTYLRMSKGTNLGVISLLRI